MKRGETPLEGEGLVRIEFDCPCVMVLWKLSNICGRIFGAF